jgi:hypothetical protein
MHECNTHFSFLSISCLKSWDVTYTQKQNQKKEELPCRDLPNSGFESFSTSFPFLHRDPTP